MPEMRKHLIACFKLRYTANAITTKISHTLHLITQAWQIFANCVYGASRT